MMSCFPSQSGEIITCIGAPGYGERKQNINHQHFPHTVCAFPFRDTLCPLPCYLLEDLRALPNC